jgi:hypothetical protein
MATSQANGAAVSPAQRGPAPAPAATPLEEIERTIERVGAQYVADLQALGELFARYYQDQLAAKDAQIAALGQRVERAEREREAFATHILAIEQANAKHLADQRALAEALSRRLAPTVENGAGPDAAA